MKLPGWLKKLRVTRVALVDKPANPEAEVVIFKAAATPGGRGTALPPAPPPVSTDGTCPQCGMVMKDGTCPGCGYTTPMKQPGLSDVNRPAPLGEKPYGAAPQGTKKLPVTPKGADEHDAYKGVTMPEPEKEPTTKAVIDLLEKVEVTELKKALEKEQTEKRLLAERVEKIELARRNELYISKAAEFDYLPGAKPDDFGPMLSKIDAALTDPERQTFWTYLRSANQAIKHSHLFGERGVEGAGGLGDSEPEIALRKIAKSKMDADSKLDFAKAYQAAITENPKLYEQYEANRRLATRR